MAHSKNLLVGILVLAGRELYRLRDVIRSRLGELVTYLTLIAGLLLLPVSRKLERRRESSVGADATAPATA